MTTPTVQKKRVQIILDSLHARNTEDYYSGAQDEIMITTTAWAGDGLAPRGNRKAPALSARMNIKEGEKKPFPVNDMFVFDQVVPVNRTITLSVHMWDLDFSASDITQAQMDLFGAALQGAGNAAAAYFGDAKAVQAADAFLRAVADKVPLATAQYAEQLDQRDELANIRQQFNVAKLQPGLYNWRVTDDGNNRNIMDIDGPQKTERNVAARSNLLYGLSNFDYTIWYRVQVTNA